MDGVRGRQLSHISHHNEWAKNGSGDMENGQLSGVRHHRSTHRGGCSSNRSGLDKARAPYFGNAGSHAFLVNACVYTAQPSLRSLWQFTDSSIRFISKHVVRNVTVLSSSDIAIHDNSPLFIRHSEPDGVNREWHLSTSISSSPPSGNRRARGLQQLT
jgi:hypothetical protein